MNAKAVMSSKRWIYNGNSLTNTQRPIAPKLVIIKQIGSGVPDLPRTGKRRRPFGGRR